VGQENTLRVTWTGDRLPADRESLFTLSIAAILSGKPGVNSVQMAFRSALKFIYHPTGLTGNAQQAYRQLRWSLTLDGLRVQNPGPYYVTLFLLNANGHPVDAAGVAAPFSTRKTTWCQRAARCAVRWQTINDYGRVLSPVTANVQLSRTFFTPCNESFFMYYSSLKMPRMAVLALMSGAISLPALAADNAPVSQPGPAAEAYIVSHPDKVS